MGHGGDRCQLLFINRYGGCSNDFWHFLGLCRNRKRQKGPYCDARSNARKPTGQGPGDRFGVSHGPRDSMRDHLTNRLSPDLVFFCDIQNSANPFLWPVKQHDHDTGHPVTPILPFQFVH